MTTMMTMTTDPTKDVSVPVFLNWAKPATFCLLSFSSRDKYSTNAINDKSVDGVLGTRTRGVRMVGANVVLQFYCVTVVALWPTSKRLLVRAVMEA